MVASVLEISLPRCLVATAMEKLTVRAGSLLGVCNCRPGPRELRIWTQNLNFGDSCRVQHCSETVVLNLGAH